MPIFWCSSRILNQFAENIFSIFFIRNLSYFRMFFLYFLHFADNLKDSRCHIQTRRKNLYYLEGSMKSIRSFKVELWRKTYVQYTVREQTQISWSWGLEGITSSNMSNPLRPPVPDYFWLLPYTLTCCKKDTNDRIDFIFFKFVCFYPYNLIMAMRNLRIKVMHQ